jgi:hypothetical protein
VSFATLVLWGIGEVRPFLVSARPLEGRDQGRPTEDRPGSDPGPGGRGHVATLAELPPAELKGVDSILAARLAGGRWRPALAQRVLCSRAAAASASA